MFPPPSSDTLTETMIELPARRGIRWFACSCRSAGDVLVKLVMDQPNGSTGERDEKNSIECDVGRDGKEFMMMDLRDLTVQSWRTNIWGV